MCSYSDLVVNVLFRHAREIVERVPVYGSAAIVLGEERNSTVRL